MVYICNQINCNMSNSMCGFQNKANKRKCSFVAYSFCYLPFTAFRTQLIMVPWSHFSVLGYCLPTHEYVIKLWFILFISMLFVRHNVHKRIRSNNWSNNSLNSALKKSKFTRYCKIKVCKLPQEYTMIPMDCWGKFNLTS